MDDHLQRQQRLLAAAAQGSTRSLPGQGGWTPPAPEALRGVLPHLEIISLIGQGGMGAVYKARQTHIDRVVAVKLMAPHLSARPDFAQRFQREAKILARLSHPHIVTLYDVGEAGGWRYLVLEFIEGATLREALTTGPFTAAAALVIAPQLCDALAYAHGQGIIHRDLKPENILIDAAGRAHIADFGLATLDGGDIAMAITRSGDVLGTAAYMAPEQLAGVRGIDHRADLYALGVIIYEMLTGHLPLGKFEAPSYQGRMDVRIDSLVMQALARTPEMRWQSAEAMRQAVDALAPATAPPPRAGVTPGVAAALAAALTLCAVMLAWMVVTAMPRGAAAGDGSARTPAPVAAPATAAQAAPPPPATVGGNVAVSGDPTPAPALPASPAGVVARAAPDPAPGVPPHAGPAPAGPPPAVAVMPPAATAAPAETPAIASAAPPHPAAAAPTAMPVTTSPPIPDAPVTAPPQAFQPQEVPPAAKESTASQLRASQLSASQLSASQPTASQSIASLPTASLPTASLPGNPSPTAQPPADSAATATSPASTTNPFDTYTAAGTGRVVITGPGEMVMETAPAGTAPRYLYADPDFVYSAATGADGTLTMHIDRGHLRLRVPVGFLRTLRFEGGGQVILRGFSGAKLHLDHAGPGRLIVEGLQVEDLTVDHAAPYPTVLAGETGTFTVRMKPAPAATGDAVADGNLVDALGLTCKHLDATIDGGGCLRLQGHADSAVAVLSDGTIDAGALSVGSADITVTGAGQARFGDLGAVNATCTGTGTVHWTGNPVLGRVIINR